VKLLRAVLVLLLVTGLQAGLGWIWPAAHRYVDLTLLPVVWYGIAGGPRAGMMVGCAAGLLQDAWFQVGVYGLNGFKKTLLGWALGSLSSRFDLNGAGGRFLAGAAMALADVPLDLMLRRLLDLQTAVPGPVELLARAVSTGLLAVWVFGLVDRVRQSHRVGRWAAG